MVEPANGVALVSLRHSVQVTIVGAGFTGLAAAFELARRGIAVTVLEAESEIGGLAAAFDVQNAKLERFYHHWFTNDLDVMRLIDELGLTERVQISPTNTGIYYAHNFFKLSSPRDLLRFTPLSVVDRLRLGLLTLRARRVKDWKALEEKTAGEWVRELSGEAGYRVVWQPLLQGKFGPYSEQISAVWLWNKLKLRGGSRGKGGEERLAYFNGGFVALAEALAERVRRLGGRIEVGVPVERIECAGRHWRCITHKGAVVSRRVIATPALPLISQMIGGWASPDYIRALERIQYLGNVCLVLQLDRPLSQTYWLSINDPSFPFVAVIEHTNFQAADAYGGRHIVYISRYLPHTDPVYALPGDSFLEYAFPYLKSMFPAMERNWIRAHHLWRARWAQPIVERHYSRFVPQTDGPKAGFHICSMAQVYPEDRGTNYAIRDGRKIGARVASCL